MRLFGFKPANPDQRQQAIAAPASARMVVNGGPGTGKTATACARVIHLIDGQHLSPASILVISFTRIAVREIAERIDKPTVKIVTLDALAALLSPESDLSEGHDEQIRRIIPQLPHCALLSGLRHVIVDEAHDVVGIRALMIHRMIAALPTECGVTVMTDDAQSIYDFADRSRLPQPALPARLTESGMEQLQLTTLYRTQVPTLTALFTQARKTVLAPHLPAKRRFDHLLTILNRKAKRLPELPGDVAGRDDLLILYRHRADVVAASYHLARQGIAHRLRMSGLPTALPAWIGLCLAPHEAPILSRQEFLHAWTQKVAGTHHAIVTPDQAWERLHRAAPIESQVNMGLLRRRLMQSSPPLDLCLPELGESGPIIGTIHASKGREAADVLLALPVGTTNSPSPEECRVWFVGATRARNSLSVFNNVTPSSQILPSGRITFPGLGLMELGLADDVSATGLTGLSTFPNARSAAGAQTALAAIQSGIGHLDLDKHGSILLKNQHIATISSDAAYDLSRTAATVYMLGIRTVVAEPDANSALHFPWHSSGFMLAPIIAGAGWNSTKV